MASALPPLAQSETKTLFLQRLDLNVDNVNDKAIYQLMKAETLRERNYMHQDRENLHPHMRDDPAYRSPFSYSWLTESGVHRAILRIYSNASPAAKHYYDLGRYTTVVEENWVIRWLLWHVFRYRDGRRTKNKSRTDDADARSASDLSPTLTTSVPQYAAASHLNQEHTAREEARALPSNISPNLSFGFASGTNAIDPRSDADSFAGDEHGRSSNDTAKAAAKPRRAFDPIRDL